ncbi:MAG: DUF3592 domain-containing protein [Desulfobacteraceae bacterium]|nr:MAG: DUF3592 domain-containing protein [Desulfobacteraceae bacterium]
MRITVGFFSIFIKLIQILMLLAGLAAFLYGTYHLGLDLWFVIKGVPVEGIVVGHQVEYESRERFPDGFHTSSGSNRYAQVAIHRPTILYRWPAQDGQAYTHYSGIWYEGSEVDRYPIGGRVLIRVLPGSPASARLPGAFTHYLWAGVGFAAGLLALVLVSSLFFLHEGFFGADLSKGLSLFRSVNWPITIAVVCVIAIGLNWFHRKAVPWLGPHELLAVGTGEMWKLPPLLATKGEPPAGQHLNNAERAFARIPLLGTAFADEALEMALRTENDALLKRYLAALNDPKTVFPLQSVRTLGYAAEKGNTYAVKTLLDHGIHPDTAILEGFEPIRLAARNNQAAVIKQLLTAGARTDYPAYPLLASAIDGKAADAARVLLEKVPLDVSWNDSSTKQTLADLALVQGMADTALQLSAKGVPLTLPRFFPYVVSGDLAGLEKVLPRTQWQSTRYQDAALLHLAARYHQPELARQLLNLGADPNEQIFGNAYPAKTPLMEAVMAGDKDMVRLLATARGIHLDKGSAKHVSPFAQAVVMERWDLAELLADAGASVNGQVGDTDGNTPLHLAAAKGDAKRVLWLLAKGADKAFKNFKQLTPLDVAGSAAVMEILKNNR